MLCLGQWFHRNQLVLNLTKTNLVKFTPTNLVGVPLTIEYKNILIDEIAYTKFLGMHIDNHMDWKKHTELILPKLSAACYAIRRFYYTLKSDALCMVYFADFHSMTDYALIFWGNSINIHQVFKLEKKIITIIFGVGTEISCTGLFRKFNILPVACQYILSLMPFIVENPK
jgi:hypothetical protein